MTTPKSPITDNVLVNVVGIVTIHINSWNNKCLKKQN
jgi:hypothetical protein